MYGTLISTQTLASTTLGVTFSSIPATYTDLVLVCSLREAGAVVQAGAGVNSINGDAGANYIHRTLYGTGSAAASNTQTTTNVAFYSVPGASATANTFSNIIITFPNYTSSTAKTFSIDAVMENNAATSFQEIVAATWTGTAAINSFKIDYSYSGFVAGSTLSLYGLTHF